MRLELERLGYLVIEAEDGKKAVEMALHDRPDIILMDLALPIMDGFAATEKIRATGGLEGVPIIAVTAHQETDFRAGAKAATRVVGRAIEGAVGPKDKRRVWESNVETSIDRERTQQIARRRHLENRALRRAAAILPPAAPGRAVEVAIRSFHKRRLGGVAVGEGVSRAVVGKDKERGQGSIERDLENRAVLKG